MTSTTILYTSNQKVPKVHFETVFCNPRFRLESPDQSESISILSSRFPRHHRRHVLACCHHCRGGGLSTPRLDVFDVGAFMVFRKIIRLVIEIPFKPLLPNNQ
jgi:hypothetical protein